MARVVALDHVVIRVSDFERSRRFYARLFAFLGFECIDDFNDLVGWRNGRTAFWISRAHSANGSSHLCAGVTGLHHYALELRHRKDVDELESFLRQAGAEIVDAAGEYYEDYYAVYFKDPDGLKIEGMAYGPGYLHGARKKGWPRA
jgi:catechol 2,3-dioxygenase-like lactoylglutathione lyase family enzyme